jgi:hypothetical protein
MNYLYALGIGYLLTIPFAIYVANKNYDIWEKSFTPSGYAFRYKWFSKSLHSMIYGLSFILALILGPLSILEYLIDTNKKHKEMRKLK